MKDIEILSIAKTYVNETVIGMGAIKGAPCQIKSIVENPAGVWTITFQWEDTTGATHTDALVLHDGAAASSYPSLSNLPTINGVTITGDMSGADLGLANLAALAAVATSGDYGDLANLPTLGTAAAKDFIVAVVENSANLVTSGGVFVAIAALQEAIGTALANKVDKITGKGLSTNDYTDAAKAIVDSVTTNLENKVDKVAGKGLSTNDYTDAAKAIVDGVTSALENKVDKIAGKGLSTNDYTDAAKAIVDSVNTNLANKVDKVTGKGLSTNDFTNALKTKLDGIAASAQVNKLESVKLNGTALPIDANKAVNVAAVTSISVQGTAQTITDGAVDLDVLTSDQLGFVSDTQYTAIQTLFA